MDATSLETATKDLNSLPHADNNTTHNNRLVVFSNANASYDLHGLVRSQLHSHVIVAGSDNSILSHAMSSNRLILTEESVESVTRSVKDILEPKRRVATLVAKGGTGKTQIALRFVDTALLSVSHILSCQRTTDM